MGLLRHSHCMAPGLFQSQQPRDKVGTIVPFVTYPQMSHTVTFTDPNSVWEGTTQRHGYQEVSITEDCLGNWLPQQLNQDIVFRKRAIWAKGKKNKNMIQSQERHLFSISTDAEV